MSEPMPMDPDEWRKFLEEMTPPKPSPVPAYNPDRKKEPA